MQFQTKKQRVQCVQGLKVSPTEGKSRLYRVQALSVTLLQESELCVEASLTILASISQPHTPAQASSMSQ